VNVPNFVTKVRNDATALASVLEAAFNDLDCHMDIGASADPGLVADYLKNATSVRTTNVDFDWTSYQNLMFTLQTLQQLMTATSGAHFRNLYLAK
jgi:hypothetical protein